MQGITAYNERPVLIHEVAEYLGVSPETVRDYVQQGLPHRQLGAKTYRFFLSEIRSWMDSRHSEICSAGSQSGISAGGAA